MQQEVQHVFLVGAKNLGNYGGFETFVDKLTEYHQNNSQIKYHVACKANGTGYMDESVLDGVRGISDNAFIYNNAHCFKVPVPKIGPAQAIYYDVKSLDICCHYIEERKILHPIIYIMACRIGPFIKHYYKRIHKLGGQIFLNPDGHEWARSKWNAIIKRYWKWSEKRMVKYSDLVICDSKAIERYIHESYDHKGIHGASPKTTYISYGAETRKSKLADDDSKLMDWYKENDVSAGNYYLIVGRFVPENNYETVIREFMKSKTKKDLVIITDQNGKLEKELEDKLHFKEDKRIKFAGSVFDQELLKKIRENAYAYIHGHEVGGTNPSLLEALGSTDVNLLLDVDFNREVAQDAALYWNKQDDSLSKLIDQVDQLNEKERKQLGEVARQRIQNDFSWQYIADQYLDIFIDNEKKKAIENKTDEGTKSNLKKLQQVDLCIAKEVTSICDQHHLTYYMIGGTMLGAIRHKGFIPWDDDIDFGMLRDDYEQFLKIAPKELPQNLKVVNYRNTPEFHYYITRIRDTGTEVIEERIGNESRVTNASIDIFPIDGTPNNWLHRQVYYFEVLFHRAMMSLCYKDSIDRGRQRGLAERALLAVMERLPIEKLTTPYKEKCKIDKLLRKQEIENSNYIGNIMGAYRTVEIVPKEFYGNGAFYQFEDTKFRGPTMYDAYLTHQYGDYMKLPPKEQRKTHFKLLN